MRFSVIALTSALLLGGCSQKGAFDLFTFDEAHERAIEQMRTASIVQSLETKAIVSAVYLNPIHPETYKEGEFFVGAFYFEKRNGLDSAKWSFEDHGYTLTLNGSLPTSLEELKENDPRRRLIPIQNSWNRYFLIRFDPVTESSLALKLENNQTGSAVLGYRKAP